VKTLYGLVIALWLACGLGMHAYFSRSAQGPAEVEQKRDLYLRQFENYDDVAHRVRDQHERANATVAAAYAAWLVAGVMLTIPAVQFVFQKAENSFDA